MKYFIISLITLIVLFTPFGLTNMNHNTEGQDSCLGFLTGGEACSDNSILEIEHHLSFFQSFSQVLVNQVGLFLLIFAFLILPFFYKIFNQLKLLFREIYFIQNKFYWKYSLFKILNWLSLFTKSPPFKLS